MVKEEIIMKSFARFRAALTAAFTAAALLTVSVPGVQAESGTDTPTIPEELIGIVTQFGDVNFDRTVSMTDAVQLQRFLLGSSIKLGNWKNADLDENDVIDIFDLAVLKRQILGEKTEAGGTLSVKVVDMMTGEPLENTNINVWAMYDSHCYDVAQWDYDPDDNVVIAGLPRTNQYQYVIDLSDLPVGYGGNWNPQLIFEYDGEADKEIVLRVPADNAEKNVRIDKYDWGQLQIQPNCGVMNITDKDGNPYYPRFFFEDVALPDGEYHVEFELFDYFEIQLLDPDNEFGKEIQALYPDVEFSDKRSGFDFTVKDGKADRELRFDFAPIDGLHNYMNVRCVDFATGEPLEGVKLSLIEAPGAYAKTVSEWTTDETGSKEFELMHAGFPAYKVQVDAMPAGYSGDSEQEISWSFVNGYKNEVTLHFVRDTSFRNVTVDIFKWEDGSLINDAATIDVWEADLTDLSNMKKIYADLKAGEPFMLPDGSYIAALNGTELREKDLAGIDLFDPNDTNALEYGVNPEHFMLQTDVIRFTVQDGKPVRDLMFFVRDYDPELDEPIEIPEVIEEKTLLPDTIE
jgi:5-hydroxyisourate hydrolase-like protein (transthyretin family)